MEAAYTMRKMTFITENTKKTDDRCVGALHSAGTGSIQVNISRANVAKNLVENMSWASACPRSVIQNTPMNTQTKQCPRMNKMKTKNDIRTIPSYLRKNGCNLAVLGDSADHVQLRKLNYLHITW